MKPPPIDLTRHAATIEFDGWRGLPISVATLYEELTQRGWKVDREESNLMQGLSKTWREAGIKVWLWLEGFACAPPGDDVEPVDRLCFYRFDPAQMPSTTMHEQLYAPGDEREDWYPSHRDEWSWLLEHGDPQFDTFDRLTPIAFGGVPERLVREALSDLDAALRIVAALPLCRAPCPRPLGFGRDARRFAPRRTRRPLRRALAPARRQVARRSALVARRTRCH